MNAISNIKIESGAQLLARLTNKRALDNSYSKVFEDGLKLGDIMEVIGEPGTGKTLLLSDIVCEAILPKEYGGAEIGVLVFNTDGNFHIQTIVHLLTDKLTKRNCTVNSMAEKVQQALQQLHFIEISNALEFYVSLQNIENMINQSNVGIILIDTITAYYWSEQHTKFVKMSAYIKNILRSIENITRDYKMCLIYTRPEYFETSKDTTEKTVSQIRLILSQNNTRIVQVYYQKSFYTKHFHVSNSVIDWT